MSRTAATVATAAVRGDSAGRWERQRGGGRGRGERTAVDHGQQSQVAADPSPLLQWKAVPQRGEYRYYLGFNIITNTTTSYTRKESS